MSLFFPFSPGEKVGRSPTDEGFGRRRQFGQCTDERPRPEQPDRAWRRALIRTAGPFSPGRRGARFTPRRRNASAPRYDAREPFARWLCPDDDACPFRRLVLYKRARSFCGDGCAGPHLRPGGRGRTDGPGLPLLVRQLQPDPPGSAISSASTIILPLWRLDSTPRGDQHVCVHFWRGHDRICSRALALRCSCGATIGSIVALGLLLVPATVTPLVVGLVFKALLSRNMACSAIPWPNLVCRDARAASRTLSARSPRLIAIDAWEWTPLMALILASRASRRCRPTLLRSRRVDGANGPQRSRLMVLPPSSRGLSRAHLRMMDAFRCSTSSSSPPAAGRRTRPTRS